MLVNPADSPPLTGVVFADMPPVAWIASCRMVGVKEAQVKEWEKGTNED